MNVEEAIVDLQVKVAFQENTIAELDGVLRALRDEIDQLRAELAKVSEHLDASRQPTPDEKPPHYESEAGRTIAGYPG